ncbi:MAG: carbohydrate binding family 9 domain-containing protein [Candidatus Glassbacteria bacterium]|nr:carbohydrate binding family 9 domain-containing protein [Candidatus Glassbacteria bacterium]
MKPRILKFLLALLVAAPWNLAAQVANQSAAAADSVDLRRHPSLQDALKTAWAVKVSNPPILDGYPEDSCWTLALPIDDFIQRRPDEGEPPTEETVVRIVYDDESIYFLFICYDSEPDLIRARLTPRDYIQSSDNVRVYLDSYFDRRTAFQFSVNAENVQADALWSEETRRDENWNAVWFSQVRKLSYGWVAEIEIPFSVLRFGGGKPFQTWGLNLTRYIERKKEYNQWRLIPESERGFFVSRFGMLGGLENLDTPTRLEFLPYAVGQLQDNEVLSGDFTRNFGLDIKYGINSGVTLDLAVNPEFGTVETDEEQLNLSPFPTYYPEKRPFFIEFQDVFRTDIRLVHTRRIGRPLNNVINPASTILTGARIVGKTRSGLRYGLIEALVDEEKYYFVDTDGDGSFDSGEERAYHGMDEVPGLERDRVREKYLDPRTNFLVGRLSKEYDDGSSLGLIGTSVIRDDSHPDFDWSRYAFTGGLDWDLRFNHTWQLSGQVAGSAVEDAERSSSKGYGLELKLRKFNGEHLTYGVNYDNYSDRFDVNDLGWVYGNDYGTHRVRGDIRFRDRPHASGVRSYNINLELNRNWTDSYLDQLVGKTFGNRYDMDLGSYTGGNLSSAWGSMNARVQFMNYWNLFAGTWRAIENSEDAFRAADDHDFIFRYPKGHGYWAGIANDYSSPFNVSLNNNFSTYRDGDRWTGSIRFRLRPRPNLELNFEPRLQRNTGFSDFSEPVETDGFETPAKILALRDTRFESYVFRTSYTMNNRLDFRLFAQYTDFSSNRHTPLEPGQWVLNSPQNLRSTLGIHFVTRFEFRPGSFFYLVYKESRFDDHETEGFSRPDRQIIGKFTYWLSKS